MLPRKLGRVLFLVLSIAVVIFAGAVVLNRMVRMDAYSSRVSYLFGELFSSIGPSFSDTLEECVLIEEPDFSNICETTTIMGARNPQCFASVARRISGGVLRNPSYRLVIAGGYQFPEGMDIESVSSLEDLSERLLQLDVDASETLAAVRAEYDVDLLIIRACEPGFMAFAEGR